MISIKKIGGDREKQGRGGEGERERERDHKWVRGTFVGQTFVGQRMRRKGHTKNITLN